jgi:glutathione synthase
MRHILFIDPLEKLNFKKDSSLMLASTMKLMGIDVYLLFEKDFYVANRGELIYQVFDFNFEIDESGFYLKKFEIKSASDVKLTSSDYLHMRIDPPFDTRYLKYLWMLRFIQSKGINVVNSPDGILKYNEKLHAYAQQSSLPSYVGSSLSKFKSFIDSQVSIDEFILKPLDLFQGFGVEKISRKNQNIEEVFERKVLEHQGAIVVQPFNPRVREGEIRSIYFKGIELGSILKVPKQGEFLANIAQGASFHAVTLTDALQNECQMICSDLMKDGVDWIAFDIMGDSVSEINITCPGLLVEVSVAHKKNLAKELIQLMNG